MNRRRMALVVALPVALFALGGLAGALARSPSGAVPLTGRGEPRPRPDHIVVMVLQNATFDNMFGTYPGADGLQAGEHRFFNSKGRVVEPTPFSIEELMNPRIFGKRPEKEVLSNGRKAATRAFNRGDMDGFLRAQFVRGGNQALAFRHFDRSTMPGLWRMADRYVLFDRYFSSTLGDSLPNILHLIAGDSHGTQVGTKETLRALWSSRFPTIFDRARERGVDWGYYIGDLDSVDRRKLMAGRYFVPELMSTPSHLYWAPVLSIRRFWTDPALRRGIHDQSRFYSDAASGRLPAISYVLPAPSTHWPTPPNQSQARAISLVNAVMKSPLWDRTAIFITWDDWGGFYDHVRPPKRYGGRLGFRVPAMLVSSRAKEGYVSHALHDHTSLPSFIAQTFGLKPVGRSYTSASFSDAWDESAPERAILTMGRRSSYRAAGLEHAGAVFVTYGVGLVLVGVAVGFAVAPGRRARRRRFPAWGDE